MMERVFLLKKEGGETIIINNRSHFTNDYVQFARDHFVQEFEEINFAQRDDYRAKLKIEPIDKDRKIFFFTLKLTGNVASCYVTFNLSSQLDEDDIFSFKMAHFGFTNKFEVICYLFNKNKGKKMKVSPQSDNENIIYTTFEFILNTFDSLDRKFMKNFNENNKVDWFKSCKSSKIGKLQIGLLKNLGPNEIYKFYSHDESGDYELHVPLSYLFSISKIFLILHGENRKGAEPDKFYDFGKHLTEYCLKTVFRILIFDLSIESIDCTRITVAEYLTIWQFFSCYNITISDRKIFSLLTLLSIESEEDIVALINADFPQNFKEFTINYLCAIGKNMIIMKHCATLPNSTKNFIIRQWASGAFLRY